MGALHRGGFCGNFESNAHHFTPKKINASYFWFPHMLLSSFPTKLQSAPLIALLAFPGLPGQREYLCRRAQVFNIVNTMPHPTTFMGAEWYQSFVGEIRGVRMFPRALSIISPCTRLDPLRKEICNQKVLKM